MTNRSMIIGHASMFGTLSCMNNMSLFIFHIQHSVALLIACSRHPSMQITTTMEPLVDGDSGCVIWSGQQRKRQAGNDHANPPVRKSSTALVPSSFSTTRPVALRYGTCPWDCLNNHGPVLCASTTPASRPCCPRPPTIILCRY